MSEYNFRFLVTNQISLEIMVWPTPRRKTVNNTFEVIQRKQHCYQYKITSECHFGKDFSNLI